MGWKRNERGDLVQIDENWSGTGLHPKEASPLPSTVPIELDSLAAARERLRRPIQGTEGIKTISPLKPAGRTPVVTGAVTGAGLPSTGATGIDLPPYQTPSTYTPEYGGGVGMSTPYTGGETSESAIPQYGLKPLDIYKYNKDMGAPDNSTTDTTTGEGGLSNWFKNLSPEGKSQLSGVSKGLMTAGLSMLAQKPSQYPISFAQSVGEGGLAGMGAYEQEMERQRTKTEKERISGIQERTMKVGEAGLAEHFTPPSVKTYLETGNMGVLEKTDKTDKEISDIKTYANLMTSGNTEDKKKAELMLAFKRENPESIKAGEEARQRARQDFAYNIEYNKAMGESLAKIKTTAEIERQKVVGEGKITETTKKEEAKGRFETNLSTLTNHYLDLDSMGSIINTKKGSYDNLIAAISASGAGQFAGRVTGSQAQSIRNKIDQIKPLLIQDIRKTTDMGARGMDSEKELAFYLQAATDPKKDIQANLAAIIALDDAYGKGTIADTIRTSIDPSLINSVKNEGERILKGKKSAGTGGGLPETGGQGAGKIMTTLPPASQHTGKIIKSSEGKRYKSDGTNWIEVQ